MLIAVIVLATLLTAAAAAHGWRYFQNRDNEAVIADLKTVVDGITEQVIDANVKYNQLYDDDTAEINKLEQRYRDLDAIARSQADKLAALSAHEALVIDRETLPAWDDVTGIHRMPVGPDSPDFTGEWNATDVQALRDRFDDNQQMALTGGNV